MFEPQKGATQYTFPFSLNSAKRQGAVEVGRSPAQPQGLVSTFPTPDSTRLLDAEERQGELDSRTCVDLSRTGRCIPSTPGGKFTGESQLTSGQKSETEITQTATDNDSKTGQQSSEQINREPIQTETPTKEKDPKVVSDPVSVHICRGTSLIVPAKCEKLSVDAVVDTAAQATLISQNLFNKVKRAYGKGTSVVLKGLGEQPVDAKSVPDFEFKLGERTFRWTVYVAPMSDDMILGLDFLKHHHATVDLVQNRVTVEGEALDAFLKKTADGEAMRVSRVVIAKRMVVPPHTLTHVPVKWDGTPGQVYCVEPKGYSSEVALAASVTQNPETVFRFVNLADHFVTLKKGHFIGVASEADVPTTEGENSEVKVQLVSDPGHAQVGPHVTQKTTDTDALKSGQAQAGPDSVLHKCTGQAQAGPCTETSVPGQAQAGPGIAPNTSEGQAQAGPNSITDINGHAQAGPGSNASTGLELDSSTGSITERLESTLTKLPEKLKDLFERSKVELNDSQALLLLELLIEYEDTFAGHDLDLGRFPQVQHKINTGDAPPFKQKIRRTPLGFEHEEEKHLNKMLEVGVIEPSCSQWASAPVLVRKRDGAVRYCIDFRRLNSITVKDAFPLPLISDCLDALAGTQFFSTLDMASGYYQIEIAPEDRDKTAFVTKYGLFQHTRMAFGLCNAPATFQRAMYLVLRGLTWSQVLAYLDDIMILGTTFEKHLQNLREVLHRFRQYNLKLKPKKCALLQKTVEFLGKLVSRDGISVTPAKAKAVAEWAVPTDKTELQSFLGFANYHSDHIQGYAGMTSPLYEQSSGKGSIDWGPVEQEAFDRVKKSLTSAPCLAYPQKHGLFILDTDASDTAIGGLSFASSKRKRTPNLLWQSRYATRTTQVLHHQERAVGRNNFLSKVQTLPTGQKIPDTN